LAAAVEAAQAREVVMRLLAVGRSLVLAALAH